MWPTIIFHMVDTIMFVIFGTLLEQRELVRTLSINTGIVKSSTEIYKIDVKCLEYVKSDIFFMHI